MLYGWRIYFICHPTKDEQKLIRTEVEADGSRLFFNTLLFPANAIYQIRCLLTTKLEGIWWLLLMNTPKGEMNWILWYEINGELIWLNMNHMITEKCITVSWWSRPRQCMRFHRNGEKVDHRHARGCTGKRKMTTVYFQCENRCAVNLMKPPQVPASTALWGTFAFAGVLGAWIKKILSESVVGEISESESRCRLVKKAC